MRIKKSNRTLISMLLIMGVIGSLVTANVVYTMVTQKHFRSGVNVTKEKENSITNTTKIAASRGSIYDRNKEVIANDETTYTLILVLDKSRVGIGGKIEYVEDFNKTANLIAPLLGVEASSITKQLQSAQDNNLYQTQLGNEGKNLTGSKKDEIELLKLPGVIFEKSVKRNYANNMFASHLIGYAQLDEETNKMSGKMGLESDLDEELSGEDGSQVYQKDAKGNPLPGTTYVSKYAKNGNNVVLTLDRNVQLALESCLVKTMTFPADRAWGVIAEVETGKILGWSSYPSFNLNERNIEDYLNVPSAYPYEPGSVMKGITYAAAIDSGTYPYDQTFRAGEFNYIEEEGQIKRVDYDSGFVIKDALAKNHGTLTFDKGFTISSNIGICELLSKYMAPTIYKDYVEKFGFTKEVDIPYIDNAKGIMNFTYASEILATGFGQGMTVTALQMVQAYSAILNDGKMVKPYVVDRIEDANDNKVLKQYSPEVVGQPITKKTSEYMRKLMQTVIEDPEGTGNWRYRMDDVSIIAKTGTGEISQAGGYGSSVYTNSVIAAAPADNPKVMMYYVFESGNILNFSGDPFKEAFRAALVATNVTGDKKAAENVNNPSIYQEYEMPELTNHTISFAQQKLDGMIVNKVILGAGSEVLAQFPQAKSTIISNQNIFLLTNDSNYKMPNMSGWSKKDVLTYSIYTGAIINFSGGGNVVSQSVEVDQPIGKGVIIDIKLE